MMEFPKAVERYLDHVDTLREEMQDREAEIRLLKIGLAVLYLVVGGLACHTLVG